MKIKLLYLTLLLSLGSNAQNYFEGFENPLFPPEGWMVMDNGVGTNSSWGSTASAVPLAPTYEGIYAAYVLGEDVSQGTPEDWLITPQLTATSSISFFSRLFHGFDQGATYRLMITTGDPNDMTPYVLLQEWTELEINPQQTQYNQKIVTIPTEYIGQQVHFAFVLVGDYGDGWIIDNFSLEGCFVPTNLYLADGNDQSELLATWNSDTEVTEWEIYIMPANEPFTGNEQGLITTTNSYTFTGLDEDEPYKVYVRSLCNDGEVSSWVGPAYHYPVVNTLTGTVMYDGDGDNSCVTTDILEFWPIEVSINGVLSYNTYTNANGQYTLYYMNDGDEITLQPVLPDTFPAVAATTVTLNYEENTEIVVDMCVSQPEGSINDIQVSIVPIGIVQPGFYALYVVYVENNGLLPAENVMVTLDFDDERLEINAVSNDYTVTDENTIVILAGDILPFQSSTFNTSLYVFEPPINMSGENILYTVYAEMDAIDDNPENNTYTLNQTLVNSYDPNSVVVAEGDMIPFEDAYKDLHYTINFQNLGTAPAVNIRVENDLDAKFDWDTFEMIASSHDYSVTRQGAHLEFQFDGIYLPDDTTDEPGSHGYVIYRVKPKADIQEGDIVSNTADIYFDFNAAITTNTATSEFYTVAMSTDNQQENKILIYPNPVKDILYISSAVNEIVTASVYDLNGRICLTSEGSNINVQALKAGLYFVNITTQIGNTTYKFIKQ